MAPPGSSVNKLVVPGFCLETDLTSDSFFSDPCLLGPVPGPRISVTQKWRCHGDSPIHMSQRRMGVDQGLTLTSPPKTPNWLISQHFNPKPSGDNLPCTGLWEYCLAFFFFNRLVFRVWEHWAKWLWILENDSWYSSTLHWMSQSWTSPWALPEQLLKLFYSFYCFFFHFLKSYWSTVDLQSCDHFCCTTERFGYICAHIHSFSDSFPI